MLIILAPFIQFQIEIFRYSGAASDEELCAGLKGFCRLEYLCICHGIPASEGVEVASV